MSNKPWSRAAASGPGSTKTLFRRHKTSLRYPKGHVIVVKNNALHSFQSKNISVAVVGGGVIGLTSALRISEVFPNAQITLIADKLATDTTSEGAAGLWKPYALSGTPASVVNLWGGDTFLHYLDIFNSKDAPEAGIFMCPAFELFYTKPEDPDWKDIVPSYRRLDPKDIRMYDKSGKYSYGFAYDTIIAEGKLYMKWILKRLQTSQTLKFSVERRRVTSLGELASYDAVFNCSGLGARDLAPDMSLYAIRGHVLRVKAPWIRYHIEAEQLDAPNAPAYIIPNSDTIVIGGTKQVGDEDLVPREQDRVAILQRCIEVVPSLQAAGEVVDEWVGLRPGRNAVRLELVELENMPPVIHNYGHGGSGLTLGYGCAVAAVRLLEKELLRKTSTPRLL